MGRDRSRWMLVGEVAELLGISQEAVRGACRREQLVSIRTPGRIRWIERTSAEALRTSMYGDGAGPPATIS